MLSLCNVRVIGRNEGWHLVAEAEREVIVKRVCQIDRHASATFSVDSEAGIGGVDVVVFWLGQVGGKVMESGLVLLCGGSG